jgi:uncharacterized protein
MIYHHFISLTLMHGVLLLVVALVAGGMNSVAGASNPLAFPVLIFVAISPIPANATTTVGMWPGSIAGTGSYRKRMPHSARLVVPLLLSSLAGGVFGAIILLHTPQRLFMSMVPYLFLGTTLFFIYGRRFSNGNGGSEVVVSPLSWPAVIGVAVVQFAIAVCGGFFGGGVGILMLALLSVAHLSDIHAMNSVRVLLATVTKSLALVTFILAKVVVWPVALLLVPGAAMGEYAGARLAQKVNPRIVQDFVVAVGLTMTAYFFLRR